MEWQTIKYWKYQNGTINIFLVNTRVHSFIIIQEFYRISIIIIHQSPRFIIFKGVYGKSYHPFYLYVYSWKSRRTNLVLRFSCTPRQYLISSLTTEDESSNSSKSHMYLEVSLGILSILPLLFRLKGYFPVRKGLTSLSELRFLSIYGPPISLKPKVLNYINIYSKKRIS